mgnify:CR=1 FL=1
MAGISNIGKIPELRKRILFTLGVLFVYRIGSYVTIPGVDARVLEQDPHAVVAATRLRRARAVARRLRPRPR